MSCNYSSFLIGCVLVIVCISLVHQMFYTPTNTLQQYIMFSVDPTTNRPMHLVLFHDDRRALYKKINHAKKKKKKKKPVKTFYTQPLEAMYLPMGTTHQHTALQRV